MTVSLIFALLASTPTATATEKAVTASTKSPNAASKSATKTPPVEPKKEEVSEADRLVAKAFSSMPVAVDTPAVTLPQETSSQSNLWLPSLALLALAAIALILTRRKQTVGGRVKILETATLGPRRSLVVAQVHGETLLLACSEAGISVLANHLPTSPSVSMDPTNASVAPPRITDWTSPLRSAFGALFPTKNELGTSATFEQSLQEATATATAPTGEDEDLRAKLAQGIRGRKS